jgi:hypothetical protein
MGSSSRGVALPAVFTMALVFCVAAPSRGVVLEAVTAASQGGNSAGALVLTTDQQLLTAPFFASGYNFLIGLTRNPLTGDLYTVAAAAGVPRLARVDFHSGALTLLGPPLTVFPRSLAFDSHGNLFGFAFCEATYANELFQFDTHSWEITALLGSLDVGNVAGCASAGPFVGAAIAIDPSDDSLYLAANDTTGGLIVDRFDSFLVPTTLYQESATFGLGGFAVTAATFAGGQFLVASNLFFYSYGSLLLFPLNDFQHPTSGSPSYGGGPFGGSPPLFGIVEARQPCITTPSATCLYNRFRVEVSYDAKPNGSGPAKPALESSESAKYAFVDSQEIDLVVRMVKACTPGINRWRVWAGGPTNVGVQIKITDTKTGKIKNYSNTKGKLFQTVFDTAAFACP